MIALFTDFGFDGPYVGQMKLAIAAIAPDLAVIDLMHDAPAFRPKEAAYLLAALTERLPETMILVGVVDPGVGSAREPVLVEAGSRRFVGPDNGLFALIVRRAETVRAWRIDWRPPHLSTSFHGRDLFAPVAATLAKGVDVARTEIAPSRVDRPDWPDDLAAVIHVDGYGNATTGLRVAAMAPDAQLNVADRRLARAGTFSDVPPGTAFWYENANGLVELAVNQGSAAETLGLSVGTSLSVEDR